MSLKTIKVNPIFLAADNAGFSAKNKTRKEKPSGISLGQSNNIKKKLIARIKNFQQNSQANGGAGAGANATMPESIETDVFSDSVQFLDNLARDKEEKKREKKNTTLKKKQPPNPEAYMNIATELPPELNWNTILPNVPSPVPNAFAPTAFAPSMPVPTTFAPTTFAPTAPSEPTAFAPPYTPSLKPRRKRITKTLKYKLGKHANGKVSVLIKNSQTRRKVQTEQALLKQKSILDIKNHLRSNNLLKVGSNAPSDVLRHLYEQSILAGQVENKAKDTLIHNFFNEEKK